MAVTAALSIPARALPLQIREVVYREEWNAVATALGAHLRQSWEWGALSGRPVHRRAIVAAGHAVAAIAMTERTIPGLRWPVLEAARGPVLGPRTPAVWPALIEAIRETAEQRRAVFVRLSPGTDVSDAELAVHLQEHGAVPLDVQWTLWNPPRVVMTLALKGAEADIKRAMRESTRLSLRKAVSRGSTVARIADADGIARFHRLLALTGRSRAYPVRRIHHFQALREEYLARGAGVVVLATYEGRDVAGVLGVRFGRSAHVLYSAIDPEFRPLRAGVAVHWELIRWAREQGSDRMDWGGSVTSYPPLRQDPGYGIFDFKRGFGCDVSLLAPYFDIVLRPRSYRVLRMLERRGGWLAVLRARFN